MIYEFGCVQGQRGEVRFELWQLKMAYGQAVTTVLNKEMKFLEIALFGTLFLHYESCHYNVANFKQNYSYYYDLSWYILRGIGSDPAGPAVAEPVISSLFVHDYLNMKLIT